MCYEGSIMRINRRAILDLAGRMAERHDLITIHTSGGPSTLALTDHMVDNIAIRLHATESIYPLAVTDTALSDACRAS